jgi:RsiW-degrading membrane proteinase PrsW (M82 family)
MSAAAVTLRGESGNVKGVAVVLLMLAATCWGVLQLAVLSLGTRTVRSGTLLLALAAGAYACGVTAVLAELAYTRLVHVATGQPLQQVVETASYTVDPVIEELVKMVPLVLVVVIIRRVRAQWGLTDFLLLGAAVGAGFAFLEAMLRYGGRTNRVISDGEGGFVLPISLAPPHIRGLAHTVTSWLPPPVETFDILGTVGADLNLHLVWTALAGLGIGLVVRMRGWRRWLGLLPLGYASLDHAANNYAITADPGGLAGVLLAGMELVRNALPVLVLLALIATTVVDRSTIRRVRAAHPDLLLTDERAGRAAVTALGRFARVALPWTGLAALRFALVRRSVWYAMAADRTGRWPALAHEIAELAERIDQARDPGRWRAAAEELVSRPSLPQVLRRWPVVLWLVLAVPVLAYFVVGAVPQTSGLQTLMQSAPVAWGLSVLTLAAVAYAVGQVFVLSRRLPDQLRTAWGEAVLRSGLRLLVGVCAITAGVAVVGRLVLGGRAAEPVVVNFHVLDALGSALLITALLLLLAALFLTFPPAGLAVVGGGVVAGSAVSVAAVVKAAALLGLAGVVLMAASKGGGGSGSGGGKGTPGGNRRQNSQFRAAVREAERRLGRRLEDDEITRVHWEISGQNYGYRDIVEVVLDMFG